MMRKFVVFLATICMLFAPAIAETPNKTAHRADYAVVSADTNTSRAATTRGASVTNRSGDALNRAGAPRNDKGRTITTRSESSNTRATSATRGTTSRTARTNNVVNRTSAASNATTRTNASTARTATASRVSRTATTTAPQTARTRAATNTVQNATRARTATTTNMARRASTTSNAAKTGTRRARTTSSLNANATITDTCREQYTQCMDNFCNVLDDNQGRCSCSKNIKNYAKTEEALKLATESLQDVAQQIQYIGLTTDEIETLFTQTEAEIAMQSSTDNSQIKNDLDKIRGLIVDVKTGTASSTETGLSFDLSGLLDFSIDSTGFDLGSLFGNNQTNTSSISNQRGEQLYKTAAARCKKSVLDSCAKNGANTTLIANTYDMEIDRACVAYERSLTDQNDEMVRTVRNANTVLQKARLMVAQQKNTYDLRGCLNALDSCMQDDFVCGTDYELCLDPTGKYIVDGAIVTGSTPGFVMTDAITDPMPAEYSRGTLMGSWTYNNDAKFAWAAENEDGTLAEYIANTVSTTPVTSTSTNLSEFLQHKIGYIDNRNKPQGMCGTVLTKCQAITMDKDGKYNPSNRLITEYLTRTLTQIKLAQDKILSAHASACIADVESCLNTNNYSGTNTSAANIAINACRAQIKTCMSVNGNTSANPTPEVMKNWIAVMMTDEAQNLCLLTGGTWDSDSNDCSCPSGYLPDDNGTCKTTTAINPYNPSNNPTTQTTMVLKKSVKNTDGSASAIVRDTDTGILFTTVVTADGTTDDSVDGACVISSTSTAVNENTCAEDNTVTLLNGAGAATFAMRRALTDPEETVSFTFNGQDTEYLKLALENKELPSDVSWVLNLSTANYVFAGITDEDGSTPYYDKNAKRIQQTPPANSELHITFEYFSNAHLACISNNYGTWDSTTNECNCTSDTYRLDESTGVCEPIDTRELNCINSGGEWTNGACNCDNKFGTIVKNNKCVCDKTNKHTIGTPTKTSECDCESGYKKIEGGTACEFDYSEAIESCQNSGGTWNDTDNTCDCSSKFGAKADEYKCVCDTSKNVAENNELTTATECTCIDWHKQDTDNNMCVTDETAIGCRDTAGTWSSDSRTCACDKDNMSVDTTDNNKCACNTGWTLNSDKTACIVDDAYTKCTDSGGDWTNGACNCDNKFGTIESDGVCICDPDKNTTGNPTRDQDCACATGYYKETETSTQCTFDTAAKNCIDSGGKWNAQDRTCTCDGDGLINLAVGVGCTCDTESGYTGTAPNCTLGIEYPFTFTVSNTASVEFNISAAGTFYVDWGDGETQTIEKGTGEQTINHSFADKDTHTVKLGGSATSYKVDKPAISFRYNTNLTAISGSLGAIFPTLSDGSQPKFQDTFAGCAGLTTLPENLFSGIKGAPAYSMFNGTFTDCTGLTKIPEGLFSEIKGAPDIFMFKQTFYNCTGLTEIPEGLFSGISGAPAEFMFNETFRNCTSLTTIPEGLFSGIKGEPANSMFSATFAYNNNLTTIPADLFSGINGAPVACMFCETFRGCEKLNGTIDGATFGNFTGAKADNMFTDTFYQTPIDSTAAQIITDITKCLDQSGSWTNGTCKCPDGKIWLDNQCVIATVTCPDNATLINGQCVCNDGWYGDGTTCTANDSNSKKYNCEQTNGQWTEWSDYKLDDGRQAYHCTCDENKGLQHTTTDHETVNIPTKGRLIRYLSCSCKDLTYTWVSALQQCVYVEQSWTQTKTACEKSNGTWDADNDTCVCPDGMTLTYNYCTTFDDAEEFAVHIKAIYDTSIMYGVRITLSAAGTFYVDWGDGSDTEIITRTDLGQTSYKHDYPKYNQGTTYTIKISGNPTKYSPLYPAISFDGNMMPITKINDKLGRVFHTLSDGSNPRFDSTFSGRQYLTSIPADLFKGISGVPAESMFARTFAETGLTSIPNNLFNNLELTSLSDGLFNGTFAETNVSSIPADLFAFAQGMTLNSYTYQYTFQGCTSLTSIPAGLFRGISNNGYHTFAHAFDGCTRLTKIDKNPFSNISGTPSYGMFYGTFSGCTNLTSVMGGMFTGISGEPVGSMFSDTFAETGLTSVPENLFQLGDGTSVGLADNTFARTFMGCSALTSIPAGLFAQYTDTNEGAFFSTFKDCTSLTSIPSNLFSSIVGRPTHQTFDSTFANCTSLTSIPANLFSGISGQPTSYAFHETFANCTNVTGQIPTKLFGDISGTPATSMFQGMFANTKLSGTVSNTFFGSFSGAPATDMFTDTFANTNVTDTVTTTITTCLQNSGAWKNGNCSCLNGGVWNGETCTASAAYTDCTNSNGTWNSTTNTCKCPSGKTLIGTKCLDPQGACYEVGGTNYTCTRQDAETGQCLNPTCTCPADKPTWTGMQCLATVEYCESTGGTWTTATPSFTATQGDKEGDTIKMEPYCACPQSQGLIPLGYSSYSPNVQLCAAYSNGKGVCFFPEDYSGTHCGCNASFPNNAYNETTKTCECKGDNISTKTTGTLKQCTCNEGYAWNNTTKQCEACIKASELSTCTLISTAKKYCEGTYSAGTWNDNTNTCKCPDGSHLGTDFKCVKTSACTNTGGTLQTDTYGNNTFGKCDCSALDNGTNNGSNECQCIDGYIIDTDADGNKVCISRQTNCESTGGQWDEDDSKCDCSAIDSNGDSILDISWLNSDGTCSTITFDEWCTDDEFNQYRVLQFENNQCHITISNTNAHAMLWRISSKDLAAANTTAKDYCAAHGGEFIEQPTGNYATGTYGTTWQHQYNNLNACACSGDSSYYDIESEITEYTLAELDGNNCACKPTFKRAGVLAATGDERAANAIDAGTILPHQCTCPTGTTKLTSSPIIDYTTLNSTLEELNANIGKMFSGFPVLWYGKTKDTQLATFDCILKGSGILGTQYGSFECFHTCVPDTTYEAVCEKTGGEWTDSGTRQGCSCDATKNLVLKSNQGLPMCTCDGSRMFRNTDTPGQCTCPDGFQLTETKDGPPMCAPIGSTCKLENGAYICGCDVNNNFHTYTFTDGFEYKESDGIEYIYSNYSHIASTKAIVFPNVCKATGGTWAKNSGSGQETCTCPNGTVNEITSTSTTDDVKCPGVTLSADQENCVTDGGTWDGTTCACPSGTVWRTKISHYGETDHGECVQPTYAFSCACYGTRETDEATGLVYCRRDYAENDTHRATCESTGGTYTVVGSSTEFYECYCDANAGKYTTADYKCACDGAKGLVDDGNGNCVCKDGYSPIEGSVYNVDGEKWNSITACYPYTDGSQYKLLCENSGGTWSNGACSCTTAGLTHAKDAIDACKNSSDMACQTCILDAALTCNTNPGTGAADSKWVCKTSSSNIPPCQYYNYVGKCSTTSCIVADSASIVVPDPNDNHRYTGKNFCWSI